jgi:uncharacterized membrane protein YfcA
LEFIDNPWFYAAAIPAIILTGVSKGGFAGAFSGLAVPLLSLSIAPLQAAGAARGSFWTTISGYTSFIAHAGDPPVMVYLMPLRMDRAVFAATSAVFFAFLNLLKLPPYAMLGQLSLVNLGTALVLAPLVPAGVKLGMWLQGKFTNAQFYRLAQACIFLTGIKLLHDGFSNLGVL